jgi:hypothetical protein
VTSGPGFIADNVISNLENNVAALEAIFAEASISASASPAIALQLATLFNSIASRVSQETGVDPTIQTDTVNAALAISAAMPAASAASAFGAAYDAAAPITPPATLTANAATDAANTAAILRMQRLAMLAGYVAGLLASTYASRPDGVNARAALVNRFDVELGQCQGASDMRLYVALANLRATAVAYLTSLITTLQPVVTATAQRSLPSIWWAWRLYQDPTRSSEIVARNRIPHPSFCPRSLEVLAPSAPAQSAAPSTVAAAAA